MTATGRLRDWTRRLAEEQPSATTSVDAIDAEALELYFEHDGERMVIGSKGGDPGHPSWYVNLRADPNVHVRVMADVYAATAEVLGDAERAKVWPLLVASYPMFADYQARTERAIPVVRLVRAERD